MLFKERFWPGLADGTVTLTFRRWKRPQVVAGHVYRSPAGMLRVTAIADIAPDDVSDEEAERAGFPDAGAVLAEVEKYDGTLYRIEFERAPDVVDERAVLAADDVLDDDAVADLLRRLARMDAGRRGPWTMETLRAIDAAPGRGARFLAEDAGCERLAYKADVRRLKALGLTHSLEVGYELSPRGRALLDRIDGL